MFGRAEAGFDVLDQFAPKASVSDDDGGKVSRRLLFAGIESSNLQAVVGKDWSAYYKTEARQREQLTHFLGVWQMSGWVQEPGENRVNVRAQVNGNIHMSYFVELAYIDFKADGFDQQIWGTTTFGYDADTGFEFNTRFSTLPDALEASGGTFDSTSRSFIFADADYRTTIRFETPDRFTVSTTTRANGRDYTLESYQLTRL